MTRLNKTQIAVLVALSAVALVLVARVGLKALTGKQATVSLKSKGPSEAGLKIVEYIDFECPACSQGVRLLNEYFQKYPDKIYLEVKYYPLESHRHAYLSARYVECSLRQDKFWPFLDLLMAQQRQWAVLTDPQPAFHQYAQTAGMNIAQMEGCLKDKAMPDVIFSEKAEGVGMGVRSTPTYFINGEMVVGPKVLKEKLAAYFGETVQASLPAPPPQTPVRP
ncbi:MAG: thioredoxin domain-containing protein [Candidatus Omnitrophota bacterium]|nr:thioredoxin domain-containing protein [Candidatus Omnitrophota bacterium]MDZ4243390.1 thioredoxin domain-containing protein [Candidatus Omnitrophota bacterium]